MAECATLTAQSNAKAVAIAAATARAAQPVCKLAVDHVAEDAAELAKIHAAVMLIKTKITNLKH